MSRKNRWKTKKEDAQHYDRVAAIYDVQYREEQERKYRAALDATRVSKCGYILDLGCGTGLFDEEAAKLGDFVIGVDHSAKMLKKAKQKHNDQRTFFLCADADKLPFAEETFDRTFSFTMLQNIPYPEKTVTEICRVSKKGSEVVLSVPKKTFTRSSFLHILDGTGLSLAKFIDEEELKDYIAVCKNMGNE